MARNSHARARALVKMSTCIVEAIDRSLRAAAPDPRIAEEKPGQKQRLTRAARVRYTGMRVVEVAEFELALAHLDVPELV